MAQIKIESAVTWGMEVEYNHYERPSVDKFANAFSWARQHSDENDIIRESGCGISKSLRQFARRIAIVGYLHNNEWYCLHHEGEDDAEAESNHLHIGLAPLPHPTWGQIVTALAWGKQFTRDGYGHRTAITTGGHSYVKDPHHHGYTASCKLPEDSKSVWATVNTDCRTIEYRLNGNPAPLFMAAACPVLLSAEARPFEGLLDYIEAGEVATTARIVRQDDSFLHNQALIVRKYRHDPLFNPIIKMGIEGASPREIWAFAHKWLQANDKIYAERMLPRAEEI